MREEVKDALEKNKHSFYHLAKTYFNFTHQLCAKAYKDYKRKNYQPLTQMILNAGVSKLKKGLYRTNVNFLKANYYKYKTN
jgi:hypothetical protein